MGDTLELLKAWIFLSAHDAGLGKHGNYADSVGATYAWDTTVPNFAGPKAGDVVLVRNKAGSLGFSLITSIDEKIGYKVRLRCEVCDATKLRWSKPEARHYCTECTARNTTPTMEYLSKLRNYEADISFFFSGFQSLIAAEIRKIAKKEKSIHSIQEADFLRLIEAMPQTTKRKLGLREIGGRYLLKDLVSGLRLVGTSPSDAQECDITGITSSNNIVYVDLCLFDVRKRTAKFEHRVKVLNVIAQSLIRGDAEVLMGSRQIRVPIHGPSGETVYEYPVKAKINELEVWLQNF